MKLHHQSDDVVRDLSHQRIYWNVMRLSDSRLTKYIEERSSSHRQ